MSSSSSKSDTKRRTYLQLLQDRSSDWLDCTELYDQVKDSDCTQKEFWRFSFYDVHTDSLAACHFENDLEAWERALTRVDAGSQLRIITININYLRRDWKAVDTVASLYQIDPAFFLRFMGNLDAALPLHRSYAEFNVSGCNLSLCIVEGDITRTRAVILLVEEHCFEEDQRESLEIAKLLFRRDLLTSSTCVPLDVNFQWHDVVQMRLERATSMELSTLVNKPHSVCTFILEAFVAEYWSNCMADEEDFYYENAACVLNDSAMPCRYHHEIQHKRTAMRHEAVMRSMKELIRKDLISPLYLDDFNEALLVLATIIEKYEGLFRAQMDHYSTCSTLSSIKYAKKANKLGESVGTVTILAFIFIPLSLVTSFFGMNVSTFGSGNVTMWLPFAAGIGLLVMVSVVWASYLPVVGTTKAILRTIRVLVRRRTEVRKICHFKQSVFWKLVYIAFCMDSADFEDFLRHCRLWDAYEESWDTFTNRYAPKRAIYVNSQSIFSRAYTSVEKTCFEYIAAKEARRSS